MADRGDSEQDRQNDGSMSDERVGDMPPTSHDHTTPPPQDNTNDSTNAAATAIATTPSVPGGAPRVIGGFAALVDAFMNSFRQASASQQQNPNPLQAPDRPPPLGSVENPSAASNHAAMSGANRRSERQPIEIPPQPQESPRPSANAAERQNIEETAQQADATLNNAPVDSSREGSNNDPPRTLFFHMPFLTNDGQSATLAFTPGPIPVPPQRREPQPEFGPDRPADLGPERGNGRASGFHLPAAPIFVPIGASPLPFSFIFDTQTNTAWPIAAISHTPPGSMPPAESGVVPGFVAGPPFHVALNITFGPPPPQPEQPDPERAQRFVDSLERADAELRKRMARLGMGAIGDYGGSQNNEGGDGALGCGICLDEYPSEDRPEWIGGQASKDEEVVSVPCAGHHTLHHRCLYEWLAKTAPSEWTCPFCRAGLDKTKVDNSADSQSNLTQSQTSAASAFASGRNADVNHDVKKAEIEAKARSLREEVRLREKARGWRCDSPACLPRYPIKEDGEHLSQQSTANKIISLLPCRHKLHLDCLCTSIKLSHVDVFTDADDGDDEEEPQDEKIGSANREQSLSSASNHDGDDDDDDAPAETAGKWVTCPSCRHEAWAELPIKRKSKRIEAATARQQSADDTFTAERGSPEVETDSEAVLGSKRPMDLPLSGARERARLLDMHSPLQDSIGADDSDGDVETILL